MNEMVKKAAEALHISYEEASKNQKRLEERNATYFWSSAMGGQAVILSDSGERLMAVSAVSPEKHIEAFRQGRRS